MKKAALWLIEFYRKHISPFKPCCCRFIPSCSEYALSAFQKYSFLKALFLSVKAGMTRCHEKPGIFPDGISGLTQRRKRKAETYGYIRLAEFSHTKKGMVKDVDGKYFKHNNKNKNKKTARSPG